MNEMEWMSWHFAFQGQDLLMKLFFGLMEFFGVIAMVVKLESHCNFGGLLVRWGYLFAVDHKFIELFQNLVIRKDLLNQWSFIGLGELLEWNSLIFFKMNLICLICLPISQKKYTWSSEFGRRYSFWLLLCIRLKSPLF